MTPIAAVPTRRADPKPSSPLASEHLPISGPSASDAISLVSLTHHTSRLPASSPLASIAF